jgi:hypothetical protein
MNYVIDSQITRKLTKLVPSQFKDLKGRINTCFSELSSFLKDELLSNISV